MSIVLFQPNEVITVINVHRGEYGTQCMQWGGEHAGYAVCVAPIEYTIQPGDQIELEWSGLCGSPRLLRFRINGGPVVDNERLWNELREHIRTQSEGEQGR